MPPDGTTQVQRELLCELNEAELLERGDALATCERRAESLKGERKTLNASIRQQLDSALKLAEIIDTKRELRDVSCTWRPDYKQKRWNLFRNDVDGSPPLETRDMTEADLQRRLPLDGEDEDGFGEPRPRKRAAAKGGKGKKKRAA